MTNDDGRLAGKVAIITGASRGIGEALAVAFAREGAAVAVAARTEDASESRLPGTIHDVAERIADAGGRALAVRCDVAKEDDRVALVETVRATLGPIDILVNNAAAFGAAPLLDMRLERYRVCYEVNVFAPYRLMQLVVPEMVERGRGWIVNISSDASRRPPEGPYSANPDRGATAYGGSKAALEHLTRSVASEFASKGIAVNAILPSMAVPTPSALEVFPVLHESISYEDFVEATLRLATADPAATNGMILYSEDILHPELGRRGWLATTM